MQITLDLFQLKVILREAAQLGADEALVKAGLVSRYLTQNSAYELYGRRHVSRWIKEGKVSVRKNGAKNSRIFIDKLELEALAKGTDFMVYFKPAA